MCWNRQAFGTALIKMHISEEEEGGYDFYTISYLAGGQVGPWLVGGFPLFSFFTTSRMFESAIISTLELKPNFKSLIKVQLFLPNIYTKIYQHSPKIMFRCFGQKGNLELVKVVGLANCCNLMPVFLMLHHQKSTKKAPVVPQWRSCVSCLYIQDTDSDTASYSS